MRTIRFAGLLALSVLVSSVAAAEVRLYQRSAAAAADARAAATVTMKKKANGSVLITVAGAGPTQRVTVPWGVAHKLAFAANWGPGGLRVLTARDGFTGNMLRLVAGQGSETVIVDRMRRGSGNGQSGVSALRVQLGVERPWAYFMGQTTVAKSDGDGKVTGRSGPARRGAYAMNPFTLAPVPSEGKTWYYVPTRKVTLDPSLALRPFAPYGGGAVTIATSARLVGSAAVGAE